MKLFDRLRALKYKGTNHLEAKKDLSPTLYPDYSCTFPTNYMIEPGNICQLKCVFCVQSKPPKDHYLPKGFMSIGHFRNIINKIAPYAKHLTMHNWGEPFLNKDIFAMISLAASRGIKTTISSNLSLPKLDHEAIVTSGLTKLIASVDGVSQETYGKYRVGGDYQLVMKNITGIQAAKKKLNKASPEILWRFLVNKFNEHEIETAQERAGSIGIDICFNKMLVHDPSWEATTPNSEKIAPILKHSETSRYQSTKRELPMAINEIVLHPNLDNICMQIFRLMIINWDGDVFPCCAKYDKTAVLGNIIDQSLNDVWNGNNFRKCREFIFNYGEARCDSSSLCERLKCARIKMKKDH